MPKSFLADALYAAQLGYDGCENFHREGSSMWLWHEAGAFCRREGRTRPLAVRLQVGAALVINDAALRWAGPAAPNHQHFVSA